jgi:hypothetical protein
LKNFFKPEAAEHALAADLASQLTLLQRGG